jgi:hypothetical protein
MVVEKRGSYCGRFIIPSLRLRVVVAKKKYWWSLLKRMEMDISIGAREKTSNSLNARLLRKEERIC